MKPRVRFYSSYRIKLISKESIDAIIDLLLNPTAFVSSSQLRYLNFY